MFETFVVQPVFNLLMLIYTILPGHNFGLAIILMTIVIRVIMHPLIKKQLHHSKAMRELQPEIAAIKKAAKGDNQEASKLIMELYKEREVSPFSSLLTIGLQVIVLIGLYTALRKIVVDPNVILEKSYDWIKNFGSLKDLQTDIRRFDSTLFGLVDLTRAAGGQAGFYFPAFVLVIGSALSQFFMGKQLLPEDKEARSLKKILTDSRSGGKKVDQVEFQALAGQSMKYLIPAFILWFTYNLPSALALYWFTTGVVGYYQQKLILGQDKTELTQIDGKKKENKG